MKNNTKNIIRTLICTTVSSSFVLSLILNSQIGGVWDIISLIWLAFVGVIVGYYSCELIFMFYCYIENLPLAAYQYHRTFLNNYYIVCNNENKWGIINKFGKEVYKIQYTYPEIEIIINKMIRKHKIELLNK